MNAFAARSSWLCEIQQGSWRLSTDQAVPAHHRGEFRAAVQAAREAVAKALEPMIREVERDYSDALDERERIVAGKK